MSNVSGGGFDDGGSGSVMAHMMALFAPPGRDSKRAGANGSTNLSLNPRPVELHPYFKRPGKGHNHDSCDACGQGGDLICCDSCPASFHFSCHAPPLEEEDIPKGNWICLRCYVREHSRNEAIIAASRSNMPIPISIAENDDERSSEKGTSSSSKGQKQRGSKGSVSKKQLEAALKSEKDKQVKIYKLKYDKYLKPKPLTNSPFDSLIAAAQVVNAEEFKLPKELESKESLPFSWKWSDERQDDFDNYPKNCAICNKTSRNIPSIGCDFCPSVYHLDCLDPPLCDIPKERWMCPNHVEHFIDSNLLTSTSLTERLLLWQKYAKSKIDPESVKLDFLRKSRSGKLFQKSRIRIPMENRLKVPLNVKDQYRHPLPGYALGAKLDNIVTRKDEGSQDEFISQLISLQTSVLRHQNEELREDSSKKEKLRKRKSNTLEEKTSKKETVETKEKQDLHDEDESEKAPASPAHSEDTVSNCSFDLEAEEDEGLCLSEELYEQLIEYLSRNRHKGVTKLSPTLRDYLALQKVKEFFPDHEVDLGSEVRARAALVPIHISKVPCLMRYRTFTIGLGSGYDVDLEKFGHCNFASPQHACIYFDQFTQVYELINYSEHGTVVDNVVYALEGRSTFDSKRQKVDDNVLVMSRGPKKKDCFCETSVAKMLTDGNGTENSAVLHHGSYIRIGCLQFIFSIMDYVEEQTEASAEKSDKATLEKDKESETVKIESEEKMAVDQEETTKEDEERTTSEVS